MSALAATGLTGKPEAASEVYNSITKLAIDDPPVALATMITSCVRDHIPGPQAESASITWKATEYILAEGTRGKKDSESTGALATRVPSYITGPIGVVLGDWVCDKVIV